MSRGERREFDLIAIGAGPAGQSAAELASFFGYRAVIVEKNKPGGVVSTTGGVPTKTLREAMLAMTGFHNREVYGITVAAPPHVAFQKIIERTKQVVELIQSVTAQNISRNNVEYLQGTATIGSDHTVVVTSYGGQEQVLSARVILVATGSRPLRPRGIPFDDPDVWDTDEFFSRGRLPQDIFIVGGGPIGVEFATVFAGLDVKTTVSDAAHRLLPTMDGEMSRLMAAHFARIGVDLILGAGTKSIERDHGKLTVTLSDGRELHPDAVLFAAGRTVNTDGLGLQEAGVELDNRGRIKVNESYQTTADGIYAAGDVIGPTLASLAMEQGRVAACKALGIDLIGVVDSIPVSAVYGMPEVAAVGLTEEQCQAQAMDYAVGRSNLALTPRGVVSGRGGLLKLIFHKTSRRLLGVHCMGDIASELVGIGQMVMHFGGTIDVFVAATMNTPTYSYAYKYATADGLRRLAASERTPRSPAKDEI